MDYFLVFGERGVTYVVDENLIITRNDGVEINLVSRGATCGFQQGWTVNKKKFSKYYQVGNMYAKRFIPNPKNYKYVCLKDRDLPPSAKNLMWANIRNRRNNLELTKERIASMTKKATLQKEAYKIALAKVEKEKADEISRSEARSSLGNFFLKQEDNILTKKKKKPKLDHNFKIIRELV